MNIIIITGASSGMGVEFALQLDNVFTYTIDEIWMIARRKEAMLEVAESMMNTTRILDMDVTKPEDMERLKKLLAKEKPTVRMLVNCAGYGVMGEFSKLNVQEELGMIDVNCKALTQMTYMCMPYMRENSRIIQLASSAAFMPQPGFAVYAASKAYVNSFSRALAEELRKKKIYVTSVCPGPVDTPFFSGLENVKEYKKTPEAFKGHVGDVSTVIRIAITSRRNTPDLHSIIALLGNDEIKARLESTLNEYK